MIHRESETRRIVKVRTIVEIDLCGLHDHQENELAALITRAARGAAIQVLADECLAFHKQQTWDVAAKWSIETER